MLPYLPRRLVLARHRVDFRRQWNGLLAECYKMGFNPYDGDCVVFIKRDKRQLRALMGDARGLILLARRFDGGCLSLTGMFGEEAKAESISSAELTMLLDGATCEVKNRVPEWREK